MRNARIPTTAAAVFLCLEALIYAAFLTLDLTGRGGHAIWLKYSGILLCLLFALLCWFRGGDRLVLPALLFTAAADWFLLVTGKHFLLGVALFLVVQTLYLIRLRRAGAGSHLWLRTGIALLLGMAAYRLDMATPLNLLAALYFSQLLSNTLLAWTQKRCRLFAVGLTLFVCCDVCVGLFNTGILQSFASVEIWLFYLPSQVLIVLSAKEAYHETK